MMYILVALIGLSGIAGTVFSKDEGKTYADLSQGSIALIVVTVLVTILALVQLFIKNQKDASKHQLLVSKLDKLDGQMEAAQQYAKLISDKLGELDSLKSQIEGETSLAAKETLAPESGLQSAGGDTMMQMKYEALLGALKRDLATFVKILEQ